MDSKNTCVKQHGALKQFAVPRLISGIIVRLSALPVVVTVSGKPLVP